MRLRQLLAAIALVAMIAVSACVTFSIVSFRSGRVPFGTLLIDGGTRDHLRESYPDFHVRSLSFDLPHFWAGWFPGWEFAAYDYELESEEVPGFVVRGRHYTTSTGRPSPPSLFDGGTLSHAQALALERTWAKQFPSKALYVGDDSSTGRTDQQWLYEMGHSITSKYQDVPIDEVYRLQAVKLDGRGGQEDLYFRLDPRTNRWTYLLGFLPEPAPSQVPSEGAVYEPAPR